MGNFEPVLRAGAFPERGSLQLVSLSPKNDGALCRIAYLA